MTGSLIAKLLSWIGLPQWALELLALGAVAGAVLLWHHKAVESGIADQVAKDDAAKAVLVAQAAKESADLQARAIMAEQAYDKEIASLNNQPAIATVRLCDNAHGSSADLPKTSGDASPSSPAAGSIQPVPAGDTGGGAGSAGVDIGPLLNALAARADAVSAELREYQSWPVQ